MIHRNLVVPGPEYSKSPTVSVVKSWSTWFIRVSPLLPPLPQAGCGRDQIRGCAPLLLRRLHLFENNRYIYHAKGGGVTGVTGDSALWKVKTSTNGPFWSMLWCYIESLPVFRIRISLHADPDPGSLKCPYGSGSRSRTLILLFGSGSKGGKN